MSENLPTITVDGQTIPEDAITFELSRLIQFYSQHIPEEEIRQQLDSLRQRAIDQAIGARLLFNEAEHLDIKVTDDDVDARIKNMIEQSGGRETFDNLLQQQNLDEKTLREQIWRGRRVDKLIEHITSGVTEPTENDIKEHFEAHREEYRQPERVLAQHILITPAASDDASFADARTRLEELRQRALDGAEFSALASDNSDCPSGKQGGSLGWFTRGMMVPEFDKAAFEMPVGGISDVIQTEFGYHIIHKTDHEDERAADFDQVHDNVRDFIRHTRRGEVITTHVNGLREKANVVITPA